MSKSKILFVCQQCGANYPRWSGKCNACGAWDTLVEEVVEATPPKSLGRHKGKALDSATLEPAAMTMQPRLSSGIGELDRVLGGGLVDGSAILIGGDPGIGKSTLLLQAASNVAAGNHPVYYLSGEESVGQIQLRARRLGVSSPNVIVSASSSVRDILASMDVLPAPPQLLIIDSIQTMYLDNLDSAPGTVAQVRASAHELIRFAKKRGIALILVGHVTKDGQIAGPRVLEHMVDCVLYFEGERGQMFRILRAVKNRFGATDEIGVFEMTGLGLQGVDNPSALFLPERDTPVSGSAVFAGMEGTRPLLVEIQALVTPSYMSSPRRAVIGWDAGRLAMLLAVLEVRAGIRLSDKEIYVNVAGGLRVMEPAADVAVAAALLSAVQNAPLPAGAVFFGELALSGDVRPVGGQDARLREAEKLGFVSAYTPAVSPKKQTGDKNAGRDPQLRINRLHHVKEMLTIARKASRNEPAALEAL